MTGVTDRERKQWDNYRERLIRDGLAPDDASRRATLRLVKRATGERIEDPESVELSWDQAESYRAQ